jgi:hypothetical protein
MILEEIVLLAKIDLILKFNGPVKTIYLPKKKTKFLFTKKGIWGENPYLSEIVVSYGKEEVFNKRRYILNEEGEIVADLEYWNDNKIWVKNEEFLELDNKVFKKLNKFLKESFFKIGYYNYYLEFEYNDKQQLVRYREKRTEGTPGSRKEVSRGIYYYFLNYDDRGNLLSLSSHHEFQNDKDTYNYIYEYDSHDNWIIRKELDDEKNILDTLRRKITYY